MNIFCLRMDCHTKNNNTCECCADVISTLNQTIQSLAHEMSYISDHIEKPDRNIPIIFQAMLNNPNCIKLVLKDGIVIPEEIWKLLMDKHGVHVLAEYPGGNPNFTLMIYALSLNECAIQYFKNPTFNMCQFACAITHKNCQYVADPDKKFIWHMLKLDVENRKYFDTSLFTPEMESYINEQIAQQPKFILDSNGLGTLADFRYSNNLKH